MNEISKEKSVLSLRKKMAVKVIAAILVVSGVGLAGLFISNEPQTEDYDLESFLESLNLPERAPYLASSSVFAGELSGNRFGYSVASAGDFNNDGNDDVVVGAPDGGYADWGRVYIFFGGDANPTTADVTITTAIGDSSNEDFGFSVAGGGDFDGNPGDEVIIGDPNWDDGSNADVGKIWIFKYDSSKTTMYLSDSCYERTEGGTGDRFGSSVAIAGDFDGSDNDDAIVGAPGYDPSSSSSTTTDMGRAYLILGKATPSIWWFKAEESTQTDSAFGESVSYAGSIDTGSMDDVIIGAPDYDDSGAKKGRAYLFHGRAVSGHLEASTDSYKMTGEADGDRFGASVSTAGNVNYDGNDDLIIGAPGYSSSKGRAYIYKGDITSDAPTVYKTLTGGATGDEFGRSVSTAGDYNKDNYDDVIVGAYKEDTIASGGTDAGNAHIFYGGDPMDEIVDVSMAGYTSSTNRYMLGVSVSDAGDFDNDGFDDVIVGATDPEDSTTYKGYAHLYNFHDHFSTTGDPISYIKEQRGYSVASGNMNGDAYDDIIVGAPYYSPDSSDNLRKGKVYVFKGSSTGIVSSPLLMELSEGDKEDNFGWSVASGNFNGDSYDDVIVGAKGYGTDKGRVYIFYGLASPDSSVDVTLTGVNDHDMFGYSVAAAETHTNPTTSYDDAIVGAPGYATSTGRIYVFWGGDPMDTTADHTKDGENQLDNFGYSVSNAGDVNGAAEDVIVGAPYYDVGYSTNVGKAYIYAGSLIGLWGPPIANLPGEGAGDNFGCSVSGAGNFNGDSYDDVIIGAKGYDDGSNYAAGKAYIYYGGSGSFDTDWDVTYTGEGYGDYLGRAVSSAGDINNDGYDDVVIGATHNDAGGTNAGRAYILYGASSGDGIEDVYITGQTGNDNVGHSVASAGDVNNDSYDDVIIGATGWGSSKGRAAVWGDPS